MRERISRLVPARRWLDATLPIALAAGAAVELSLRRPDSDLRLPLLLATLTCCAGAALRRWRGLECAMVAGCVVGGLGFASGDARLAGALPAADLIALALLAYSLGAYDERRLAPAGVLGVALAIDAGDPHPVLALIGSIIPYIAGRTVRSRQRMLALLEQRARELEQERDTFTRESVIHERARVARELHDIVAHCLTVIAIQAGAGHRLAHRDPELAREALEAVAASARQAQAEIDQLVAHLSSPLPPGAGGGMHQLDELVDRAVATGLPVRLHLVDLDRAPGGACADAVYGVVQESLTNALKHAPGAPVEVTVRGAERGIQVMIANGPPLRASGLERAGGGHGLRGMRERMAQLGGTLEAGPAANGGWRVTAWLPRAGAPTAP